MILSSRTWRGYGGAVGITIVAALVRVGLRPLLQNRFPLTTFMMAVVLSAWDFGSGPALLAMVTGGYVAWGWLMTPAERIDQIPGLVAYFLIGLLIIYFSETTRKAKRMADEQVQLARQRLNELEREIVERERAEELRKQANFNLSKAQGIAHVGSWSEDLKTRKLEWSDETYRIFGLAPGQVEVTQEFFFSFVHPEDREDVRREVAQAVAQRKRYSLAHRIIRPDGSQRYVQEEATVILDEDGKRLRLVGTIQDVTEQRHLEQQLRQSQKMEAIGRLATGVTHDFNNLLTVISGYAEMAKDRSAADSSDREMLEQVLLAAERAKILTRQLLAFSRGQKLQPKVLSLNTIVASVEKMLTRVIGEDVRLKTNPDPELGLVTVDPGQIEQVILNLAVNARDAMPAGGTLTIETANVNLDETYPPPRGPVHPGPYVLLLVSDNGTGMDDQTKARIFEPFFTTKPPGQGTGLGLATVYGIVQQSGGCIRVYSERGFGTTFRIYFPQVAAEAEAPQSTVEWSSSRGSETVLVVEDETPVRELVRDALSQRGYTVLATGEISEALDLCRARPVDLLLTDVVMPELSGPDLVKQVVLLSPKIKVLYMSGYTGNAINQHGLRDSSVAMLDKPFTIDVLAQRVRAALDMWA